MRIVWEMLKVLWAVGCVPVGFLLLVVMVTCGFSFPFFFGFTSDAPSGVRWLFWALILYFAAGGWLLLRVDQHYAVQLRQLVANLRPQGFTPDVEVYAKLSDAYLSVDSNARRLLVYPVEGAVHFFQMDEVNSWRIVPVGKRNHRLELLTSSARVPMFSVVLKPTEVPAIEARFQAVLGAQRFAGSFS
jgi:hypothetical protein